MRKAVRAQLHCSAHQKSPARMYRLSLVIGLTIDNFSFFFLVRTSNKHVRENLHFGTIFQPWLDIEKRPSRWWFDVKMFALYWLISFVSSLLWQDTSPLQKRYLKKKMLKIQFHTRLKRLFITHCSAPQHVSQNVAGKMLFLADKRKQNRNSRKMKNTSLE